MRGGNEDGDEYDEETGRSGKDILVSIEFSIDDLPFVRGSGEQE